MKKDDFSAGVVGLRKTMGSFGIKFRGKENLQQCPSYSPSLTKQAKSLG